MFKKKVLTPSQLRITAMDLIKEYKVSVRKATSTVILHRSVWYYKIKAKNDEFLYMRMNEIGHTNGRRSRYN